MICLTDNNNLPDFVYGYKSDVFLVGELNRGSKKVEDGLDTVIATLIEMLGSVPTKFLLRDEHKNYNLISFKLGKEDIEIASSPLLKDDAKISKNTAIDIFKAMNKDIKIQKAVFSTKHSKI